VIIGRLESKKNRINKTNRIDKVKNINFLVLMS